jgi:hypothetical protein
VAEDIVVSHAVAPRTAPVGSQVRLTAAVERVEAAPGASRSPSPPRSSATPDPSRSEPPGCSTYGPTPAQQQVAPIALAAFVLPDLDHLMIAWSCPRWRLRLGQAPNRVLLPRASCSRGDDQPSTGCPPGIEAPSARGCSNGAGSKTLLGPQGGCQNQRRHAWSRCCLFGECSGQQRRYT